MRIANLIFMAGAVTVSGISNGIGATELQSTPSALEQCSAFSEAGMRECLVMKSHESTTVLKRAEEQAIVALSKWDEDTKYISLATEKFRASSKAYEQYREAQCAFASALGGGAIGNALELRRLSCRVELNAVRTKQLAAELSAIPIKVSILYSE